MTVCFRRGAYVVKPVLSVGVKKVAVLLRVAGYRFSGVRLVVESPYVSVLTIR
jgi:hypothetical protein